MQEMLTSPEVVRKLEGPMMYGGALISIVSGLTLTDWGVLVGIIMGLAGGVMKWREHRLILKKTQAEIREIEERRESVRRAAQYQVAYHNPNAQGDLDD